ncbi:uridine-cytidine kinase-like protein-like 1 [Microthyrium microscopicum]|uniref:Uridine kinase n=1 Tax=Microthyrium microscopicum TaxID=703497 RepID=A0A6A6UKW5_9PEZI|nr:uridine-cytidine kinase-like protein-like 1 [Microthyrium microscopicum]
MLKAHYRPPWADTSIIGVAGSSGSGKTSLALAVIRELNLPWVIILSMDAFYKPLTPEQSALAFQNKYDFDAPDAIDFDALVEKLQDIKAGKRAEIPIYSFQKHAREKETQKIYSPHVLVLEGIFALYDQRVLDMLDLKVFAEADADVCLSRRILRDVQSRGRDIQGCIAQWFAFVKPNFTRYVLPQRDVADIIVPRGIENLVAISMLSDRIKKTLAIKSAAHQQQLARLGNQAQADMPLVNVEVLAQTPQVVGINTLLLSGRVSREDFIFYVDRLAALLVEKAVAGVPGSKVDVVTPQGTEYAGYGMPRVSAVTILRGGSVLETGLKRVIPDCQIGRLLIQTNYRTAEPELHYCRLAESVGEDGAVLLLDAQASSGGAAVMAVQVLVDHGVKEERIVFVALTAGRIGIGRLVSGFPRVKVVVARLVEDDEERWLENKYLGC